MAIRFTKLNSKTVYYLDSRFFNLEGESWEILASKDDKDKGIEEMKHLCRNLTNGECKVWLMKKLTLELLAEDKKRVDDINKKEFYPSEAGRNYSINLKTEKDEH